jgi:prophage antirepressor-like protein
MSELQIFNFNTFPVRTIEIKGKILFIAKDVASCLGYERPSDAISQHCKKAKSLKSLGYGDLPIQKIMEEFGTTSITTIPESDVYRLVMRSKLERAEEFQDWVCEDVLPSIRKTGSYGFPEFLKPITEPIALADFEWRRDVICQAIENLEKAQVSKMMTLSGKELLAGKYFEK